MSNTLSSLVDNLYPTSTESSTDTNDNIALIWLDPNIGSDQDTKTTKEELRRITDRIQFYTDLVQCVDFIQLNASEKIFIVTSGAKASTLLALVSGLRQVDSVFIFCMKQTKYVNLMKKYPKIVGVFMNRDELCQSIREEIQIVEQHIQTYNFFDRYQKYTRDITHEFDRFLWYQLFSYVITRFPRNEESKQQMIEICRQFYHRNIKKLRDIDEFERTYRSQDAIRWYSKETFVYNLVNKALRTEDINLLYKFRFFIGDLTDALRQEHTRLFYSKEDSLTVYRCVQLKKQEFDQFKENQSKLISTNGYLSTSRSREFALNFAKTRNNSTDLISILFEIKCDIKSLGHSVIFADIAELSEYPHEREVLFDLNACFQIESIQEDDDSIQIIKMTVSQEGEKLTKSYIEEVQRFADEQSITLVFGRLICDLGEYDKAQKYFEDLLNEPNGDDPAWIEFNIGRVFYRKGLLNEARDYYDRAYKRMLNETSIRMKDLSHIKNNIGNILFAQENYDEALKYHNQALKLREKYYPLGDVHVGHSLMNIGNVYHRQGNYSQAFHYYQQTLKIYQDYYLSDHKDIARCLNNIGMTLADKGHYDKAIEYHEKSLKINEKYYSSGHLSIGKNLENLAICYQRKNRLELADRYFHQALTMYEKFLSKDHSDCIRIENHIEQLRKE